MKYVSPWHPLILAKRYFVDDGYQVHQDRDICPHHPTHGQNAPNTIPESVNLSAHQALELTFLGKLNPIVHEEVREVLDLEIPLEKDWKEVNIHHALLRIIGMVSGRIFIGPELSRTEKYLDAAINYTMEVMSVQRAAQKLRPWLRPFLATRLPESKKLNQRIQEAEEFLGPVIKARLEAAIDDSEKPFDMLQWLIEEQPKFDDKNSRNLARVQLGLTFAAIHTTTLTATNA